MDDSIAKTRSDVAGGPAERIDELAAIAARMVEQCRRHGADQAEVGVDASRGLSVGVRLGEVETLEYTRGAGIGLTVYFGGRKGSASCGDLRPESLADTVEKACAIARHTEPDPAAGLADAALMAVDPGEFDTWHPWDIDAEAAIVQAVACEQAGREADARISNVDGTSLSTSETVSVYANSHGFLGTDRATHHSLSCALIAGAGSTMQRSYWYTHALAARDMESAEAVGRRAAERTVARLDPRPVPTGRHRVMLVPEMARSVIGHLLGAVSGGALYRRSSFLLDRVGTQVLPGWLSLVERPHRLRGLRSAAFDAEGVATRESDLVRDGVLARYLLSSYSARRLGLETTANAGGIHNLDLEAPPSHRPADLQAALAALGTGLVVTELMGQGVNPVTGDYSRGAAGFWVEDGHIVHAVDELTIAGNLKDMLLGIEAVGADVDPRSHVATGSMILGEMMVASAG